MRSGRRVCWLFGFDAEGNESGHFALQALFIPTIMHTHSSSHPNPSSREYNPRILNLRGTRFTLALTILRPLRLIQCSNTAALIGEAAGVLFPAPGLTARRHSSLVPKVARATVVLNARKRLARGLHGAGCVFEGDEVAGQMLGSVFEGRAGGWVEGGGEAVEDDDVGEVDALGFVFLAGGPVLGGEVVVVGRTVVGFSAPLQEPGAEVASTVVEASDGAGVGGGGMTDGVLDVFEEAWDGADGGPEGDDDGAGV